jgi:hypothetical protein
MVAKQYLVIVESPGKIKKLKSLLGVDYEIIASMGHVINLPPKAFGLDLEKMQGDYIVLKADVAKRLRSEAQKSYRVIYLASNPDRADVATVIGITFMGGLGTSPVAQRLWKLGDDLKLHTIRFDDNCTVNVCPIDRCTYCCQIR